ncbi:hypothetical protein QJS66_21540 [Kocuria rhizophila]|nr:hypothetical protein QJS66_21540 [Kocuria rhizophila]
MGAMENLWLATVELGVGVHCICLHGGPHRWQRIVGHARVPDDLELMAVPANMPSARAAAIDWSSRERDASQYVLVNLRHPQQGGWDQTSGPATA